jgi:hypothetical protein
MLSFHGNPTEEPYPCSREDGDRWQMAVKKSSWVKVEA